MHRKADWAAHGVWSIVPSADGKWQAQITWDDGRAAVILHCGTQQEARRGSECEANRPRILTKRRSERRTAALRPEQERWFGSRDRSERMRPVLSREAPAQLHHNLMRCD
jgi:hypothetical protein